MNAKRLWFFTSVCLAALYGCATGASAPSEGAKTGAAAPPTAIDSLTMERPKEWEVGDNATYKWVLYNKAQQIDEELTAITDTELQYVQRAGGRTYEGALERSTLAALKGMCLGNGQQCAFAPANPFWAFPLQKGKMWMTTFTVKGETFTSEVTQERWVDKIEKVKVPAGEFEAYKISFKGKIRSTDKKGGVYTGKEDGAIWVTLVNGKANVVKIEYRNTFGEKATRELAAVNYK